MEGSAMKWTGAALGGAITVAAVVGLARAAMLVIKLGKRGRDSQPLARTA
jgi:hypothetical protein